METDAESHCTCWITTFLCFISVYLALFNVKNPLQYHVKFATYVTIVMTYAFFFIPFLLFRPNDPRNINTVAKHFRFLLSIFKIKYSIENSKYLQINQPYILISNHQSSLDFITMMTIWPNGNCTPLAKKELLYTGPFGVAIWLCGITFIDRLNHDKAKGTIKQLAERINRENLRVWIFPEGTRSPKADLLPFKKGAFHLAIQAQIPIVSVVVSSYSNFYCKKEKKFLANGEVKVSVLPPFQTKGMSIESVGRLSKHLQEKMQKEFDRLNDEINLEEKYLRKKEAVEEEVLSEDLENTINLKDTSRTYSNFDMDLTTVSPFAAQLNDDNNNSIHEDEIKKDI